MAEIHADKSIRKGTEASVRHNSDDEGEEKKEKKGVFFQRKYLSIDEIEGVQKPDKSYTAAPRKKYKKRILSND